MALSALVQVATSFNIDASVCSVEAIKHGHLSRLFPRAAWPSFQAALAAWVLLLGLSMVRIVPERYDVVFMVGTGNRTGWHSQNYHHNSTAFSPIDPHNVPQAWTPWVVVLTSVLGFMWLLYLGFTAGVDFQPFYNPNIFLAFEWLEADAQPQGDPRPAEHRDMSKKGEATAANEKTPLIAV